MMLAITSPSQHLEHIADALVFCSALCVWPLAPATRGIHIAHELDNNSAFIGSTYETVVWGLKA